MRKSFRYRWGIGEVQRILIYFPSKCFWMYRTHTHVLLHFAILLTFRCTQFSVLDWRSSCYKNFIFYIICCWTINFFQFTIYIPVVTKKIIITIITCQLQHHRDVAIVDLGHILTRFVLTHPKISSMISHGSFYLLVCSFFVILDIMSWHIPFEVEITGKIDRPFLARNSVFRW